MIYSGTHSVARRDGKPADLVQTGPYERSRYHNNVITDFCLCCAGQDEQSTKMEETWSDRTVKAKCESANFVALKLKANRYLLIFQYYISLFFIEDYCKSTIFGRYKIWWIDYVLSDNRGFS